MRRFPRAVQLIHDRKQPVLDVLDQVNRPRKATHSKLTPETADAIRAGRAAGQSGKDLAAAYGVSPAVVSAVWHGEIWNPTRQISTRGTEMRRRLVAAFDGGLRAGEMMRIQLSHVNWRPVLLGTADGPPIEA